MIRRALVAALVLVVLAGCSTTTDGRLVPASPLETFYRQVADPIDADAAHLGKLERANDQNVGDWTPVCANLADDATSAGHVLRTYPWPARARTAARELADGLDVEVEHAQECAGADGIDALGDAVRALPNLYTEGDALRAALR